MILSQKRVNELLKIFDNPKSINPYDNSKEKEEMKNASTFIANYHIYGRPTKYNQNTNKTSYNNNNISQTISRNQTINSKGSSLLRKLTNGNKKLNNYNDIQIQKSLTNLKIGQQEYMKEQQVKLSKKNDYYKNYNAYSTISYSSEFEKNQRIYNSILNSSNLATTNYLYEPNNYKEKKYNSQ